MSEQQTATGGSRKAARWALYLPYIIIAVLVLGVSVFWFVARSQVEKALDAWLVAEGARGRAWTCPERGFSGFPMRFEVSCVQPTFVGQGEGGRVIRGEMAGFRAVAQIYDPNLVAFDFRGPLTVSDEGRGVAGRLSWEGFSLSVRRSGAAFSRLSAYMKQPRVELAGADGTLEPVGRADAWDFHMRPDPSAPAADLSWDVATQLVKVNAPALNMLSGTDTPVSLELQAVVSKAAAFIGGVSPERLDRWRDEGGRVRIGVLKLNKGAQMLDAQGYLGLDPERRLDGRLEVKAAGLSQLLARFTGGRGGVGGLLSGGLAMLGARAPSGGEGAGGAPAMTQLPPVVFANGQMFVGPFPVLRLQPLQ